MKIDGSFLGRAVRRHSTHGNLLHDDRFLFVGLESVFVRQTQLLSADQRCKIRHAFIKFTGEVVQDENLHYF